MPSSHVRKHIKYDEYEWRYNRLYKPNDQHIYARKERTFNKPLVILDKDLQLVEGVQYWTMYVHGSRVGNLRDAPTKELRKRAFKLYLQYQAGLDLLPHQGIDDELALANVYLQLGSQALGSIELLASGKYLEGYRPLAEAIADYFGLQELQYLQAKIDKLQELVRDTFRKNAPEALINERDVDVWRRGAVVDDQREDEGMSTEPYLIEDLVKAGKR